MTAATNQVSRLQVQQNGKTRNYRVNVSMIYGTDGTVLGRTLLFHETPLPLVAPDMRDPLAILIHLTGLLEGEMGTGTSGDTAGLLQEIKELTRRLHRYVAVARTERSRVSVYFLGGVELCVDSVGTIKWRTRKSAELFAYLLLKQGRKVPRATLIVDIFNDMPLKNAETYLNTTIYQLRKSLEPHGLKQSLQSDKDCYWLDFEHAAVDFIEFEERLEQFAAIDSSNLEQALELEARYRGDLFGNAAYSWAINDIEQVYRKYEAFVKKLGTALLELNQHSPAIKLLLKLFQRNELDEEVAELLLKAYAAQKNRMQLTKQYRLHVKALKRELGISPSEELARLYFCLLSEL
jgi:two-component SAPR family response regulator